MLIMTAPFIELGQACTKFLRGNSRCLTSGLQHDISPCTTNFLGLHLKVGFFRRYFGAGHISKILCMIQFMNSKTKRIQDRSIISSIKPKFYRRIVCWFVFCTSCKWICFAQGCWNRLCWQFCKSKKKETISPSQLVQTT